MDMSICLFGSKGRRAVPPRDDDKNVRIRAPRGRPLRKKRRQRSLRSRGGQARTASAAR